MQNQQTTTPAENYIAGKFPFCYKKLQNMSAKNQKMCSSKYDSKK